MTNPQNDRRVLNLLDQFIAAAMAAGYDTSQILDTVKVSLPTAS